MTERNIDLLAAQCLEALLLEHGYPERQPSETDLVDAIVDRMNERGSIKTRRAAKWATGKGGSDAWILGNIAIGDLCDLLALFAVMEEIPAHWVADEVASRRAAAQATDAPEIGSEWFVYRSRPFDRRRVRVKAVVAGNAVVEVLATTWGDPNMKEGPYPESAVDFVPVSSLKATKDDPLPEEKPTIPVDIYVPGQMVEWTDTDGVIYLALLTHVEEDGFHWFGDLVAVLATTAMTTGHGTPKFVPLEAERLQRMKMEQMSRANKDDIEEWGTESD